MSPKRKKKRHRSNSEHRRKERKRCVRSQSPSVPQWQSTRETEEDSGREKLQKDVSAKQRVLEKR